VRLPNRYLGSGFLCEKLDLDVGPGDLAVVKPDDVVERVTHGFAHVVPVGTLTARQVKARDQMEATRLRPKSRVLQPAMLLNRVLAAQRLTRCVRIAIASKARARLRDGNSRDDELDNESWLVELEEPFVRAGLASDTLAPESGHRALRALIIISWQDWQG
jgi:hypothetical protein